MEPCAPALPHVRLRVRAKRSRPSADEVRRWERLHPAANGAPAGSRAPGRCRLGVDALPAILMALLLHGAGGVPRDRATSRPTTDIATANAHGRPLWPPRTTRPMNSDRKAPSSLQVATDHPGRRPAPRPPVRVNLKRENDSTADKIPGRRLAGPPMRPTGRPSSIMGRAGRRDKGRHQARPGRTTKRGFQHRNL
jgi:hypothetical protein